MKLKRDTKFVEESTHRFKIGIRNLTKFDLHIQVLKIFILMGSYWAQYILFGLKKYREIIFHKTEGDTKFGEESTCRLKIGIKNFTKFDPRTQVSKIFILMGSYWAQYILFELKKWRGIDLSFQNWHKEFDKFWPEHSKVSKIFTLMGSFWGKYVLFELKK